MDIFGVPVIQLTADTYIHQLQQLSAFIFLPFFSSIPIHKYFVKTKFLENKYLKQISDIVSPVDASVCISKRCIPSGR